jgi:hypothetical protein
MWISIWWTALRNITTNSDSILEICEQGLLRYLPHTLNSRSGFIGINYLFPEWIKKGLDKILGTLHAMGNPYVWYDVTLEPWNHISTSMSSVFDLLTPNSIGNIFLPWIVHMYDTVSLSGKHNTLESRNHMFTSMSSALDLWLFYLNFDR